MVTNTTAQAESALISNVHDLAQRYKKAISHGDLDEANKI